MAYTNSPMVSYTKLSPNHSGQRTHSIDRITPHCVVGQCTVETLGDIFYPTSRQASCQYGIGKDGRVAMYVEEKNRSWCSSSNANDQRAITIECASDTTHPYAFRDIVYQTLIALCVDICKRNGKKKLLWLGGLGSTAKDKVACENYTPAADEMILTAHRFYANKSCPGDWMYARMGDLAAKVTAQLGGGNTATTEAANTDFPPVPFLANIIIDDLNIRTAASMSGSVVGQTGKGTFTITEVKDGWGRLKSGKGWIYLENPSYCTIGKTVASTPSSEPATPSSDNEKVIWDTLYAAIGNAYGVAGLMGNLYAESALNPRNLQNNGNTKLGMTDAEFTAAFDAGKYAEDTFIHDGYGYGLAQWTYYSRKEALVKYAKAAGKSIGDLAMQLGFLIQEIKGYAAVWKVLTTAKTVREASDAVLLKFERPADQSEAVQKKRSGYGEEFFKKYAANSAPTPTKEQPAQENSQNKGCTADRLIAVAVAEIGYKEKASNANLDDKTANAGSANYTKYACDFDQKYPNWYNGKKNGFSWCDMFCDWCFLTAFGYENALRLTCQPEKSAGAGCTYSLRYYKNKGQFHTSDPKPGDQIFFGTSIDNSSHTGIVEKVDGSKVYTIEGNTSDMVARRSYALNNSRILGYGRPAYDSTPSSEPATPSSTTYYRVRKSWSDKSSQIGAYTVLQNAKNCVDANPGYAAFDDNGNQVYPAVAQSFTPYRVKVSITNLNYRKGPSTSYSSYGYIPVGVYTIVDEQDGWGLLKAYAFKRNGWIKLSYTTRI